MLTNTQTLAKYCVLTHDKYVACTNNDLESWDAADYNVDCIKQ